MLTPMTNPLPKYLQPWRMAERGTTLTGQVLLAECERLHDLLGELTGHVDVTLKMAKDGEGYCYLQGDLQTELPLTCQRCMSSMRLPLQIRFSLSPVYTESAGQKLPSQYEPLLLAEDQVPLLQIVEEELLLALPFAPKHEEGGCEG